MQHIHRYVYFWTTGSGTRHVGALLLVVGAPWDDAPSKRERESISITHIDPSGLY